MLELGSGAGLAGIAICSACKPVKYIFTDCHRSVLQRLSNNVERNGLTGVCVEELDWKNVKKEDVQRIEADIVIAAGSITISYDVILFGNNVGT